MAQYFYQKGGIYNDKFWELTNEFIDEITDFKLPTQSAFEGLYYMGITRTRLQRFKNLESPLLANGNIIQYIYYLKKLSTTEYIKIENKYMKNFFNTINSKEYLIFDQIITDAKPEIDKKIEYLGDFKLICVYRDPRDIFTTGILKHADWIPNCPKNFVKWFKRRGVENYIKEDHPKKLVIRFEDFVLKYDETSKIVNEFLGLNEKNHINIKKYFKPEISGKNIGIYKNNDNLQDIKYIEDKLNEYCYK